jgi:dihydrofolate reductase
MTGLTLDISMSLDGFVAGPNITMEQPLGEGGELLHDWITRLASWRARHGQEGGETGPANDLVERLVGSIGAYIMGRRMFSGGTAAWEDDPNADGWWGDEPPFRAPVFVLTHHEREPLVKQGGTTFTFVTDGIESALEQAKAAAGERDVQLSGGADVVQQYIRAGLVDALQIHIAPVLLGGGTSLFGELGAAVSLQPADATHITLTPAR